MALLRGVRGKALGSFDLTVRGGSPSVRSERSRGLIAVPARLYARLRGCRFSHFAVMRCHSQIAVSNFDRGASREAAVLLREVAVTFC